MVPIVLLLTSGEQETRRVSFAVELLHAQKTEHVLVVQDMSVDSVETEVEQDCSSETQQVLSEFV